MAKSTIPLTIIAYDAPDDTPVLVLGNSLGTSHRVWADQVAAFSDQFRLVSFELPGHGHAGSSPGPYSIADLGKAVLDQVFDANDLEKVPYCGVSLGGMIGMWLAAHAPDRIEALGLVCTTAYLPPAEGWRARAELVTASGMEPIVEASIGRWFTPEFAAQSPHVVDEFATELSQVNPIGYAGCCLAIADMDLRADLALVKAPTLVISGGRDPSTPPEHGAEIVRRIAGARQLVVDDAAHLANVSSPEVVTAALLEHLTSRPDRRE
ncbi:MAG TPA: 3-oxoadipate enol-lactonase [Streptosporangiaceae bacterium]|nr:3-oxoadipate enol-lactonase [Streptosporangiaceae bacterium]